MNEEQLPNPPKPEKKKKRRTLSPHVRNKILYYVNAFWGFLALILGLVVIFFSGLEYPAIYTVIVAIGVILCTIFTEINTIVFRFSKKALRETLPFLIAYVIILILAAYLPNDENGTIILAILMSVYIFVRLAKVFIYHLRRKGKQRIFGCVLSTIIAGISIAVLLVNINVPKNIVDFTGIYFIIDSLVVICMSFMIGFNPSRLIKVLVKTRAIEVLAGLLILMFVSSIILPFTDASVGGFGNAMWYCFALVTTIGFGDITVTSFFGRIISVILGIYGIGVVALLTSIIVNLYNESNTARQEKQESQNSVAVEGKEPKSKEGEPQENKEIEAISSEESKPEETPLEPVVEAPAKEAETPLEKGNDKPE